MTCKVSLRLRKYFDWEIKSCFLRNLGYLC